ncbi:hypothetical protein HPB52_007837 [Rhipicephalus sanguineus]|uniref:Xrn1 helical domain-containing protein n=1 Tax=Rhipicephalus sanguineus TaxID=34632 RepID=A0A9D4T5K2_RHISA|nr:hypothetical protein HPB52_007837 [Rhipicephalus sanguineus]
MPVLELGIRLQATPFQNLMYVIHPSNTRILPECMADLIDDEESPLAKYYPSEYDVDRDGEKYMSKGVAIIPRVNEEELYEKIAFVYPLLEAEEGNG